MKQKWEDLINAESKNSSFEFFYYKKVNRVRVVRVKENELEDDWVLTVDEWRDLCELINRLTIKK